MPPTSPGGSQNVPPVNSHDPNSLTGPNGFGIENYLVEADLFGYEIFFQNATNATGPAQIAQITDPLSTNLDWTTFQLTEIDFGNTFISIPSGSQYYANTFQLSQSNFNFGVQISAGINANTGVVYANFFSINPTNRLPPPAGIGFLPPEDGTGRGTGHVLYTVRPRQNIPTGTQITNVAYIQFDQNPVIATDEFNTNDLALVTIDSTPPVSSVSSLPAIETSANFTVCWSGTDAGPGIVGYDIYASTNSGPWGPWLVGTTKTCAPFTGQSGMSYGFYSVAHDGAGLVETTPSAAQASTTVMAATNGGPLVVTNLQPGPNSVAVSFNRPVDPTVLYLYGSATALLAPPDVSVVGDTSGPVMGSLLTGPQTNSVIFVKTGGPFAPDAYTVTLRSATNGFKDLQGNLLAGNGVTPGAFTGRFTNGASPARIIFVPDFARGPGQQVNLPATSNAIPVVISEASNVLSASFTIGYDTNLLRIITISPDNSLPAGWTLTTNVVAQGQAAIGVAGAIPLGQGAAVLARISAEIPWCATYGAADGLFVGSVSVNNGGIAAVGDIGVQVVAYLGDVTGDRSYTLQDSTNIASVAVGLYSGFAAYPLVAPVLVGDVSGDGIVNVYDAELVAQKAEGLSVPLIPNLPLVNLVIAMASGQVTISWPACTGNYILQSSTSLGPQANWTAVTNTPASSGDQNTVTVNVADQARFYRLQPADGTAGPQIISQPESHTNAIGRSAITLSASPARINPRDPRASEATHGSHTSH